MSNPNIYIPPNPSSNVQLYMPQSGLNVSPIIYTQPTPRRY